MDIEPVYNEGNTNIADIEQARFRAARAELGASNSGNSLPAGIDLKPFGDDGLTFGDILDVINPLHYISVISTIYRNLTGGENCRWYPIWWTNWIRRERGKYRRVGILWKRHW